MQQSRAALLDSSKQLKNLEFEKGALQQSFDEVILNYLIVDKVPSIILGVLNLSYIHVWQIKKERDELYKWFENGMFKIQQKCDLKNLLIQRKVQVLEQNLEKKVKVFIKIWCLVILAKKS